MIQNRPPIILEGQLYLNEALNEYLIVTKNDKGHTKFQGKGFKGQMEDESFIDYFPPVDPQDVSDDEINQLLAFSNTKKPLMGFLKPL